MIDCAVVGGGVIGMFTAWELTRSGLRVAIVERGKLGGEASWAAGGMLTPLCPWRVPAPLVPLIDWGQARYPLVADELTQATGIDPQWTDSGLLILGADHSPEVDNWASTSSSPVEFLDRPALFAIQPHITQDADRAIWLPRAAQVRNPRLCLALKGMLQQLGVQILDHTAVRSLIYEGDQVTGLITDHGRLKTRKVVIAAGAWSTAVLNGLPSPRQVTPIRGQMIAIQAEPGLLRRMLLKDRHYLIPRGDGLILVGSTLEDVGFDKSVTDTARKQLSQAGYAMLSILRDFPVVAHWGGLRPRLGDEIPWIGAHPQRRGLYVTFGHYRNGITLAPGSARLLVDIILKRPPLVDPQPFSGDMSAVENS